MRIFYKEGEYSSKVNFVDENNVLLGYDNENDCCAKGGWFISKSPTDWLQETFKEESMELPGFIFDTAFIKGRELADKEDEGNATQFRLVNGKKEKFLTLYNFHNGYYSRGFEFSKEDKVIKEGEV